MAIASTIQDNISRGHKMLAVLIDPEKADASRLDTLCPLLNEGKPDFIFVGGSTGTQIEQVVLTLKQRTTIPVVLFPGNVSQFTPSADALSDWSPGSGRPKNLKQRHRHALCGLYSGGRRQTLFGTTGHSLRTIDKNR